MGLVIFYVFLMKSGPFVIDLISDLMFDEIPVGNNSVMQDNKTQDELEEDEDDNSPDEEEMDLSFEFMWIWGTSIVLAVFIYRISFWG